MQFLGKQFLEEETMLAGVSEPEKLSGIGAGRGMQRIGDGGKADASGEADGSVGTFSSDALEDTEEYDAAGLDALCRTVMTPPKRLPLFLQKGLDFLSTYRKQAVIGASVLAIGLAVYVNWSLYGKGGDAVDIPDATVGAGITDGVTGEALAISGDDGADDGSDYFAVSQINRQRARDEAIEVLQTVADGAENLSDVQGEALEQIAKIAKDIEHEAAIESLVCGKGFEACIAVISGENANVIVRTGALLPNEVTQIQEIVYETAGIVPANVKIIEK